MMAWELWQFSMYAVFSIAIGVSCLFIGFRRSEKLSMKKQSEKYLFKLLVMSCGVYHLLAPFFIYYKIFFPLIGLSAYILFVSLLFAVRPKNGA